ncbi:uncharacterized protein UV8b_07733 [Ustilaginoidea virens]|uniref:Uncharacterized protein n=1 Tax=Ustilaginoidea virens TaxID=1159556 RepID=A0A8E5MKT0_USTVR|nr:uncharacterized protein UV8b_07733 [Ustilaginoidea virens]QUC23492.1 hypothetical protein UV8b_07733 [Ustilaginoidea virens]
MNCYSRPTGSREAYQGIRTVMNPMARGVSSNVQVIHVSERNTDADTYMELHVQTLGHFPPESDAAAESQGQQVPVLADSYALVSLREAKQQYLQYIQASLGRTLRTSLGRRSGILYQTYLRAYYTMKDDSASQETRHLLVLTFKLWMSIRLSSKPIVMIGAQDVDEHGTPQPDGRPTWTALPPNIVMQLDYVLTGQIQMELREKVLSGLDNMVYKRKQRNWLTIYLATFILLHNLALIKADNGTCTAKCRTERCKHELAAEEYHKSANNLLAHFHFCNNGVQPFSEACPSYRLADLLDGNDDTVKFIQNCRSHVRLHRQHWDAIRRNCQYDDEYFFISQLFDDRWAPHPMESERPRGPSLAQMV